MTDCVYPNCTACKFPYCMREEDKLRERKIRDRRAYYKKYYQDNKPEIKNKRVAVQYVRWIDVKKTITRLRKQIGDEQYMLIKNEVEKIERHRQSDMGRERKICHQIQAKISKSSKVSTNNKKSKIKENNEMFRREK